MSALSGMKAICGYMNRSESTVLILIRDCDFPARKILGSWESDTELVDKWRQQQIIGISPANSVENVESRTAARG